MARESVPKGGKEKSDYGNLILGDDYKQPGERIRAMSQESRDNLKHHLCAWIGDPKVSIYSVPAISMYEVVSHVMKQVSGCGR